MFLCLHYKDNRKYIRKSNMMYDLQSYGFQCKLAIEAAQIKLAGADAERLCKSAKFELNTPGSKHASKNVDKVNGFLGLTIKTDFNSKGTSRNRKIRIRTNVTSPIKMSPNQRSNSTLLCAMKLVALAALWASREPKKKE